MKKTILILALSIGFNWNSFSQSVTIGKQVWMSKNLDLDKFRNGDSIPQAKTYEDWKFYQNYYMPTWCYYNFDSINEKHNGKLYNWYAVNDSRKLCPLGWHVPTDAEWTTLTTFLGGETVAGGKMKQTGLTGPLGSTASERFRRGQVAVGHEGSS